MSEKPPLLNLILRAIGVSMGIAVVSMSILDMADHGTLITLLGLGVFALAMDALNR